MRSITDANEQNKWQSEVNKRLEEKPRLRKIIKIDQFDCFDPKGNNLGDHQFTRVEYDDGSCTWHRGWHKLNHIPNSNFAQKQLDDLNGMYDQYKKDQDEVS